MRRRRWLLAALVVIVLLASLQLPGVDVVSEGTAIGEPLPGLAPGLVALGALALLPLVGLTFWVLRSSRDDRDD